MLLALNAFQGSSTPPPTPSSNRTPIGLLLALTRPAETTTPPPATTARTPIGLLLALTRPAIPVEPPIEPPVEVPASNYAGGGGRRMIRKFRKRKREELEELLDLIGVTPPEVPAVPAPPEVPLPPGLLADVLADMPTPPLTVLRSPPDEDEDEIALLLELLS